MYIFPKNKNTAKYNNVSDTEEQSALTEQVVVKTYFITKAIVF